VSGRLPGESREPVFKNLGFPASGAGNDENMGPGLFQQPVDGSTMNED
jgi:hypothetical protein